MTSKKALILFCEGPHDVAFCGRVLKDIFGLVKSELKFTQYPSPFGDFFATQVANHSQKDLSLDMAHKFFLPDAVYEKDDNIVFLFNTGGKDKIAEVQGLLADLIPLLRNAMVFRSLSGSTVVEAKFLFMYDADHFLAKDIHEIWHNNFKIVDSEQWLDDGFNVSEKYGMSALSYLDKAVYVWGGADEQGTLEDLLIPIFQQAVGKEIETSMNVLKSMFTWMTEHQEIRRAIAEGAKLKKSVLTMAGQRKKPGSSLNVIIGQSGFLTKKTIEASDPAMKFCNFVSEFANIPFES